MVSNWTNKIYIEKEGYTKEDCTKLNNTRGDRLEPLTSEPQQTGILQSVSQPFEVGPPDVFQVNNPALPAERKPHEQQEPKGHLRQEKKVTTLLCNYFSFIIIFFQRISIYIYICFYIIDLFKFRVLNEIACCIYLEGKKKLNFFSVLNFILI